MNSDILPPGWKKIKRAPKPVAAVAAPEAPAPDLDMPLPEINIDLPKNPKPKHKTVFARFMNFKPREHWYNLNRTEKIMTAAGILLVVAGLATAIYLLLIRQPATPVEHRVVVKAAPKPTTVAAPLTGLQVDPSLVKRPVTAIMIENSLDARPQSGLQDAGIVYEAIAEGGITRFSAIFQDTQPQYIGPVRSLRPYYIDFFTPFDAAIAHVGGSPEALDQIRSGGKDLDQFFNAGSYWRQATRDAPHNVYTSFEKLDNLNLSKGYISSSPKTWPRKKDSPLKVPAAKSIDLDISSGDFNIHYDYDAATNSYMRFEGGKPHLVSTTADNATAAQVHPKVVIAPIMSYGIESDGKHSQYGTTGSGPVYVFQDGGVTQGTWSKADRASQFVFKDTAGKDIPLTAGQTWVTALSDTGQVHYAP
ncbi:MAG: hypothetical protein JWO96_309 [Candidatus Saccharibacteria bacterium]|nr:hypothetical protein [Candidatus Saccharibacteria bacterium]